jgi:hypothetical protein
MIVIGSKPYNNLNMNEIIDKFKNNMRFNFAIPEKNNGTKIDSQLICREVLNFMNRGGHVKSRKKDILDKFQKIKYDYNNIYIRYDIPNLATTINKYLSDVKIPIILKNPRSGILGIMDSILKSNKPFLYMYSIYDNEIYSSFYDKFDPKTKYDENTSHDSNLIERRLILSLHKKNIIDASFCMLKDVKIPTFDIHYNDIQPTLISIKKILDFKSPICVLEFNDEKTNIDIIYKNFKENNVILKENDFVKSNTISIKKSNLKYSVVFLCSDVNLENFKFLTNMKEEIILSKYKKNTVLIFNSKNLGRDILIDNVENIMFHIDIQDKDIFISKSLKKNESQKSLQKHNFSLTKVKFRGNYFLIQAKKMSIYNTIKENTKTKKSRQTQMQMRRKMLMQKQMQRQKKRQMQRQKQIQIQTQQPQQKITNNVLVGTLKQQELNIEKAMQITQKKNEEITKQINYYQTQKINKRETKTNIELLKRAHNIQQKQQTEINQKLFGIKKQIESITNSKKQNIKSINLIKKKKKK